MGVIKHPKKCRWNGIESRLLLNLRVEARQEGEGFVYHTLTESGRGILYRGSLPPDDVGGCIRPSIWSE